jgi:hypothetical protein
MTRRPWPVHQKRKAVIAPGETAPREGTNDRGKYYNFVPAELDFAESVRNFLLNFAR